MCSTFNPVVLVHGLNDDGTKMLTIAEHLRVFQRQVYCIDLLPSNGTESLTVLAQQLAQFVNDHIPHNSKFDLVGFSMGGLITRYYLQRLGGINRVDRYVTIAAPHQGTIAAYFTQLLGCTEMRSHSMFLQDLQQDIDVLSQLKFTSIWTPFDLMIVPAWSSQIPGSQDIQLPIALHPWLVSDQRAIKAVLHALDIENVGD